MYTSVVVIVTILKVMVMLMVMVMVIVIGVLEHKVIGNCNCFLYN